MTAIKCWPFLILILIPVAEAAAGHEADDLFAFADHLDEKHEYYRAVTEYMRFIFLYPEDSRSQECRFRICRSYLEGGRLDDAVNCLIEFLGSSDGDDLALSARYSLGAAHYCLHDYPAALVQLELIPEKSLSITGRNAVTYSRLWCYLHQKDFRSAYALAGMFDPKPTGYGPVNTTLSRTVAELELLPRRKPALAGIMSAVIPGTGQFYSGHWEDGALSLLLNALFIGGIIHSLGNDHNETAAVLGFFELGWYSANIYNAVDSAHQTNRRQWERHLDFIENTFGSPFQPIRY
ncbi:hypothetical protein JXA40_01535 [bacterium]|nr:hypothetical protein [candidate division CSSED10-310 bacterium]